MASSSLKSDRESDRRWSVQECLRVNVKGLRSPNLAYMELWRFTAVELKAFKTSLNRTYIQSWRQEALTEMSFFSHPVVEEGNTQGRACV